MKAVQVTFEDEILDQLDQRPEVRERGRSAVLHEVIAAYLARKRDEEKPPGWDEEVARSYEEGYRKFPQTDEEITDWESVEVWLDE